MAITRLKLNRFSDNDYRNRIQLCVAYVLGGKRQRDQFVVSGGKKNNCLLSVKQLCQEAVDIYMTDFDNVDPEVIRTSYNRMLSDNGKAKQTTALRIKGE